MTNSAHQLHSLIERAIGTGSHVVPGWESVLDAKWQTPEFARRHAEIVRLFAQTVDSIEALGNLPARERMQPYIPRWWNAIIAPTADWTGSTNTFKKLISESELDHLANVADILEARLPAPSHLPDDDLLAMLEDECQVWLTLINGASELPAALRLSLMGQVQHLLWLIEHAATFGVARVAQEAQSLLGAVVVATAHTSPARRGVWTTCVTGLLTILAKASGVVDGSTELLEAANDSMSAASHLIESSAHLVQGILN